MSLITSYTYLGGFGPIASETAKPVDVTDRVKPADPLERAQVFAGVNSTGFGKAPPPSPELYWRMRTYQTCAFAYSLIIVPILAGTRTLVIRNADGSDGPPPGAPTGVGVQVREAPEDKRKKRAEDDFETLWSDILTGGAECLNFGSWTQEVIWDRRNGLTVPTEFKSFLPWEVHTLRDKFNNFAGFRHRNEERGPEYAFRTVWAKQFDPLFGVPRAEQARESWWRAIQTQENMDKIERKASGIQMMLELPTGSSFTDASGNPVLTRSMVQTIVNASASGQTFTIPIPWKKEDIKANPELAKVPLIRVQQFDWGKVGPELEASIKSLERKDVEIVRAYQRPEREAMEGRNGTKAEAGVQGQVGVKDSELVGASLYDQFNKQTFNRYLATNYGAAAVDSMYWKMAPLADPQQEYKQAVTQALLASPTAGPQLQANVDGRRLLKETELPLVPEGAVVQVPAMPEGPAEQEGDDANRGSDEDETAAA